MRGKRLRVPTELTCNPTFQPMVIVTGVRSGSSELRKGGSVRSQRNPGQDRLSQQMKLFQRPGGQPKIWKTEAHAVRSLFGGSLPGGWHRLTVGGTD